MTTGNLRTAAQALFVAWADCDAALRAACARVRRGMDEQAAWVAAACLLRGR